MTGVHRLADAAGTTGLLVACGAWSLEVRDVSGPDPAGWLGEAERWAAAHGRLDLRSAEPLPGTTPVAPGEHVRPVPLRLADADATRALGAQVAGALRPGDLLVLSGPLGAGKTTFAQGLGQALGVQGRVTSPTFVLARVHRGAPPLVHVDAYRLRETAGRFDLDDLDLDTAVEHAVTVVEWGEGLVEQVADSRLDVRLDRPAGDGADSRTAQVLPVGARWRALA